jgi:hypothetical protein
MGYYDSEKLQISGGDNKILNMSNYRPYILYIYKILIRVILYYYMHSFVYILALKVK